jgi:crotonobetainyl-CoA:carnitine CoA-transferase CaiB-like acyl-CoA transferase
MVMGGVMSGLKVLDLSWGITGPMAAMLLGDHGAEVTRIERPSGDPFPDMLGYKVWHRGKRSAVLDLKDAGDHDLFLRLAADADVLIESFSPGVTKRLGIDFDRLAAINPRLIYCSITAYGEDVPEADRKGYDALVAARVGLQYEQRGHRDGSVWYMTGGENPYVDGVELDPQWLQGADREGPLFVQSTWPSLGAFFSLSVGIAAALYAREKTGRGQRVTTSLLQGAMACASGVWQRMEEPDAPGFNSWIFGSKSPKGHYRTSDGRWIHTWVPNPRFVLQASKGDTIDLSPDLSVHGDPDRFGTGPEEQIVMAYYQPMLADAVRKFTAAQWVHAAAVANVPLQEARPIGESLIDPLLIEDRCVVTVEDPELGPINQVGITFRLTESQGEIQGPARPRGADTDAVRAEAARLPSPVPAAVAPAAATSASAEPPLKGIRVLDLGMAIAGPFACQLLSDLGADVIKVNTLWDKYWHDTHIAYMANRGKRSIQLMLKHPEGMAALKKLIATADVVQHNMRYGAVQKLGLDYETLSKEFPKLIYCHTRGFEKGPRMGLPGNDQTGACLAGIQHADGGVADGGKPIWSLTSLGDTGNGFLSAIGILNALRQRERTGLGTFVDTSIINACLLNTSYAVATPEGKTLPFPRIDAMQTGLSPYYRLYQTRDGWVQVAAVAPAERAAFDAFAGPGAGAGADLGAAMEARTSAASSAELLAALGQAGIPAELSDDQYSRRVFDNAEYRRRQWTAEYNDPAVGKLEQIGHTYDLSATPSVIQSGPLLVGGATFEIMQELGYSQAQIDDLAASYAVACTPPRPGQKQLKGKSLENAE